MVYHIKILSIKGKEQCLVKTFKDEKNLGKLLKLKNHNIMKCGSSESKFGVVWHSKSLNIIY